MHSRDCVILTKLLHPPEQGRRDLNCTGSTRDSKTVLLVLVFLFWGKRKDLLGTFPRRTFFSHLLLSGLAASPVSFLAKFGFTQNLLIFRKKNPYKSWQQGAECHKEQGVPVQQALSTPQPGTAGTGWHLAKKIGNPEKKRKEKKTTKKAACPGHACYSRGSGEQGADSGRFKDRRFGQTSPALCGAGGAESRVCSPATPAFSRGPGWASAAIGTHPSTGRAQFWGWRDGRQGAASCSPSQRALCLY